MKVFFSVGGRRSELISYFGELDEVDEIHVADIAEHAPAFEFADVGHYSPKFTDPKYVDIIADICKKHRIDLLLSLNDLELPLLAKGKQQLEKTGVSVIVSESDVIETCFDKSKTRLFLQENGFKVPELYSEDEKQIQFPVIIKPRFGTASIGVEVAEDRESFGVYYPYSRHKVARSILNIVEGGTDLLIEQKIEGVEYAVDILNNLQGEYCGSVVKRKLGIRGGDADLVVTENNEQIVAWTQLLSKSLRHVGNLDCDLIVNDDGVYCVDLNPRFGGAYPFSHLSGINVPEILVRWRNEPDYVPTINVEAGIVTARTESYLRLEKFKSFFPQS